MGKLLADRIKQESFSSPFQEAMLSLIVASDRLLRTMEDTCSAYGITAAQYNVLRILRGVYPGGHPRCDIIDRMLTVAPDVTRLIDRLEKLELAERTKSEEDRRLSLTKITQKGLDLLDRMQKDMDDFDNKLKEYMSLEDARKLTELAEQVSLSMQ